MRDRLLIVLAHANAARFVAFHPRSNRLTKIDTLIYAPTAHPASSDDQRTFDEYTVLNSRTAHEAQHTCDVYVQRFATTLASQIEMQRSLGKYEKVIIAAPPMMLYSLHAVLDEKTLRYVVAELFGDHYYAPYRTLRAMITPYLHTQHEKTHKSYRPLQPRLAYNPVVDFSSH